MFPTREKRKALPRSRRKTEGQSQHTKHHKKGSENEGIEGNSKKKKFIGPQLCGDTRQHGSEYRNNSEYEPSRGELCECFSIKDILHFNDPASHSATTDHSITTVAKVHTLKRTVAQTDVTVRSNLGNLNGDRKEASTTKIATGDNSEKLGKHLEQSFERYYSERLCKEESTRSKDLPKGTLFEEYYEYLRSNINRLNLLLYKEDYSNLRVTEHVYAIAKAEAVATHAHVTVKPISEEELKRLQRYSSLESQINILRITRLDLSIYGSVDEEDYKERALSPTPPLSLSLSLSQDGAVKSSSSGLDLNKDQNEILSDITPSQSPSPF